MSEWKRNAVDNWVLLKDPYHLDSFGRLNTLEFRMDNPIHVNSFPNTIEKKNVF